MVERLSGSSWQSPNEAMKPYGLRPEEQRYILVTTCLHQLYKVQTAIIYSQLGFSLILNPNHVLWIPEIGFYRWQVCTLSPMQGVPALGFLINEV